MLRLVTNKTWGVLAKHKHRMEIERQNPITPPTILWQCIQIFCHHTPYNTLPNKREEREHWLKNRKYRSYSITKTKRKKTHSNWAMLFGCTVRGCSPALGLKTLPLDNTEINSKGHGGRGTFFN
jgi:hypothetical protein